MYIHEMINSNKQALALLAKLEGMATAKGNISKAQEYNWRYQQKLWALGNRTSNKFMKKQAMINFNHLRNAA